MIYTHHLNFDIFHFRVLEIQQNMMKLTNQISKVICDIIETYITQYRLNHSTGVNTLSGVFLVYFIIRFS